MSLHDRIMRLRTDPHIETLPDGVRVAYKNGHKVARHDAAEMCLEADELIAEMAEALDKCRGVGQSEAIDADYAYTLYLKYKEATK